MLLPAFPLFYPLYVCLSNLSLYFSSIFSVYCAMFFAIYLSAFYELYICTHFQLYTHKMKQKIQNIFIEIDNKVECQQFGRPSGKISAC